MDIHPTPPSTSPESPSSPGFDVTMTVEDDTHTSAPAESQGPEPPTEATTAAVGTTPAETEGAVVTAPEETEGEVVTAATTSYSTETAKPSAVSGLEEGGKKVPPKKRPLPPAVDPDGSITKKLALLKAQKPPHVGPVSCGSTQAQPPHMGPASCAAPTDAQRRQIIQRIQAIQAELAQSRMNAAPPVAVVNPVIPARVFGVPMGMAQPVGPVASPAPAPRGVPAAMGPTCRPSGTANRGGAGHGRVPMGIGHGQARPGPPVAGAVDPVAALSRVARDLQMRLVEAQLTASFYKDLAERRLGMSLGGIRLTFE